MKKIISVIVFIFILTFTFGCESSRYKNKKIITTHYVAYDIAKYLAKNKLSVGLLPAPGADIHSFEYTSDMVASAMKAKLLITTSKFSDYKLMETEDYKKKSDDEKLNLFSTLYPKNNKEKVDEEEIFNHIKKHHHESSEHHDEEDKKVHKYAHFYSSYGNVLRILAIIRDRLIQIDPKNRSIYEDRQQEYLKKSQQEYEEHLYLRDIDMSKKELFFLGHDSLGLFEEEFTLKIIPLNAHISSDKPNTSKEFKEFIDLVNKKKPKYIFIPELSENEHLKTIEKDINHKVEFLELHSLHNISKDDFKKNTHCFEILKRNLQNIKQHVTTYDSI